MIYPAHSAAFEPFDDFDEGAKDALPLAGNLLLRKFDAVEAECDRRGKAASVRGA